MNKTSEIVNGFFFDTKANRETIAFAEKYKKMEGALTRLDGMLNDFDVPCLEEGKIVREALDFDPLA